LDPIELTVDGVESYVYRAIASQHDRPRNMEPEKCDGWSWMSATEIRALVGARRAHPSLVAIADELP
jgi:hypothetical protein